MRMSIGRVVLAAACLMWLAGCETTSIQQSVREIGSAADGDVAGRDATGSVNRRRLQRRDAPPLKPELLGSDPNDDLSIGKKYFRQAATAWPSGISARPSSCIRAMPNPGSASPRPTTGSSASISPTAPTRRPSS